MSGCEKNKFLIKPKVLFFNTVYQIISLRDRENTANNQPAAGYTRAHPLRHARYPLWWVRKKQVLVHQKSIFYI
jgi:hypothetical protein